MEKYIQIGVTALRDPVTREFLPGVPMYIKATPEAEDSRKYLLGDMAKLFAEKMREYKEKAAKLEKEKRDVQ
jgi:hypothetical protein